MASFANTQSDPDVDFAPYFASGSIANATNATITFDNVTEWVKLTCPSTGDAAHALCVGVTTSGVEGTQRMAIPANTNSGEIPMRVKQLVIRGGGSTCGYQIVAVLRRQASSDYPDITTANGFEGV